MTRLVLLALLALPSLASAQALDCRMTLACNGGPETCRPAQDWLRLETGPAGGALLRAASGELGIFHE